MILEKQKRVAAIHDISCVGKCSLTVALPVVSAAGAECSVLPTAVLSTHTGGFTGFTFRDLTEDMEPIANHWKTLDIAFDAVYTGYLGSFDQLALVGKFIGDFRRKGTLALVDPVMGDQGKLYQSIAASFPAGMKALCAKADVIVPNLTEAAFMLGEPYVEPPYSRAYIEGLLQRLAGLGPRRVVLTGVAFSRDELGAATYDADAGEARYAMAQRIDGYYHGTGDVFSSALLGALLNGFSLDRAARVAVDFTVASIKTTRAAGTDVRFGVNFEANLPAFMQALGRI